MSLRRVKTVQPGEVLLLSARDVDVLLDPASCIAAVERGLRARGEGRATPTGVLGLPLADGGFHVKVAAFQTDRHYFAAKINGNFPANPAQRRLPTIQGVLALFDAANGTPLALIDSIRITALRTAAATAVAARRLARSESSRLLVVGCGVQAAAQLDALRVVLPISSVMCHDVRPERAVQLADRARRLGLEASAVAAVHQAARASDVIVTCTTSRQPLLGPADVPAGCFVAAVGADNEGKQELEPALMAGARVVVDLLEQCLRIGDLRGAVAAGAMTPEEVHAELADVVAGRRPGRRSAEELFVLDSTGTALQDVVAAAAVYERAVERGSGTWLRIA